MTPEQIIVLLGAASTAIGAVIKLLKYVKKYKEMEGEHTNRINDFQLILDKIHDKFDEKKEQKELAKEIKMIEDEIKKWTNKVDEKKNK